MSKARWSGNLSYYTKDIVLKDFIPRIVDLSSSEVPVTRFSVRGGASREIELARAHDMSISSEFEQARQYKNLRLHLTPQTGFAAADLMEIALKDLKFTMTLIVRCQVGKTVTQTVQFGSTNAKIAETPGRSKDGKGNESLLVSLQFKDCELIYMSPQGKYLDIEDW